ncbi:MAG TPA: hypothetical protein DHU90_15715, partial [Sphingobacterium sp.]|nr:hypothetical protein [Sphingobacterium sp.]
LRTLFGDTTDIVQMLIRFRPAPDQELPGQGLVNIYCKIVAFRSWYEHDTRKAPLHQACRHKNRWLMNKKIPLA